MKNQNGLGLIGILLIIGALVLTAGGVVVWKEKEKVSLSPTVLPTPAVSAPTPLPKNTTVSSLSIFSPSDVLNKKDTLIGKRIVVRGYARRGLPPCLGVYSPECNDECVGSVVLSETQKGNIGPLDHIRGGYIYGHQYPGQYESAIWLMQDSRTITPFRCTSSGLKRDGCVYECSGWELGILYRVTGIWKKDEWYGYFLEIDSKQRL